MVLIYFSLLLLVGALGFHLLTKKYVNPYLLTMVIGKKGSGKSTLIAKLSRKHIKSGWTVFSTEHTPGTYLLDPSDIGKVEFPENSCVFIDEVGMIWDNRGFKHFPTEVRDWFKLQRHRSVKVYLFSQTYDIDKKIRDLVDQFYLVEKKARVFSYGKRVCKKLVLNDSTAEAPSKIDENLVFDTFLLAPFGSRLFTFIPYWTKFFDSYSAPLLSEKDFEYIDELE